MEKFWKTSGEELKESYKWASDIRAYSRSASVDLAADTKGMPLPKTLYSGTYHGHTGSAAKGKDGSYRYGRSESNKAYQMSALQAQKNKQPAEQRVPRLLLTAAGAPGRAPRGLPPVLYPPPPCNSFLSRSGRV